MATVSWDNLFPLLAPHLPGVPDMSMREALAASTADFLMQTHLWREELDPFDTEIGVAEYELFGTAVIESVLWVLCDATEIHQTDPRLLPKEQLAQTGRPNGFWIVNDRVLRLHPTPEAVYPITGAVSLKPSRRARGVEDWIYETWADALVSGAVYRLARTPNKAWSDPQLAQYHKTLHDRAVANAKTRDFRQINLRVQMRGG